jgi:hypothetical protein
MATMNVKDAAGDTVAIEKPLAPGRTAASSSRPVALSSEDKTALDALATQTTLAAVLAKIIAAPATEAKQDILIGLVDGLESALASILAKIIAAPATEAKQDEIVAAIGNIPGGGGGSGTEYTEDAAAAANPTGGVIIAVRRDTLSDSEVTADGDNIAVKATAKGQLHVLAEISQSGLNANGRAAAAASAPIVFSTEDFAAINAIATAIVTDDAVFTPATSKVGMAGFQADEASTDSIDEGDAGAARMTLDRKQIITLQPHTNGGLSVFRSLDLDETEEDVKTSPGCLYKLRITNRTTSVRYVKLYNETAANVTVGTTTPLDTIPVPANASDYTVLTENFGGVGLTFDTALSIAATTGFADNDTGAPGTNDIIVSAYFK